MKVIVKEALMAIVILLLGIAVIWLGSILEEKDDANNTITTEEVLFDPSSLPPLRHF